MASKCRNYGFASYSIVYFSRPETHMCANINTRTQLSFICQDPAADGDTVWTLTQGFLTFFTGVSYSPTQTGAWLRLSLLPCQQVAVTEGVRAKPHPHIQATIVLSRYSNSLFHSPVWVQLPTVHPRALYVRAVSAYLAVYDGSCSGKFIA